MFIAKLICILSVCYIPVLLAYTNHNETKFKKGLALGVTIPKDYHNDPEVQEILADFKKTNKTLAIVLTIAQFAFIPIQNFNWFMFFWGLWLLVCVVLPYIPFAKANNALKTLKAERGWRKVPENTVSINTAAIPKPAKEVSIICFAIPLIISLLPIIFDKDIFMVYLIDAITIALFYVCYKFAIRKKSERVNDDISLTEALTNLRRNSWSKVWLLMSYGIALINIAVFISNSSMLLFTGGVTVIGFILVIVAVKIEFDTRKLQEELTKDIDVTAVDEDDYWIWGMFYYNPNDSHLIVNNRVGINTGINLAKTAGKVLLGLSALLLLSIPFIMPVTDMIVNKAPEIEYADEQLLVNSGHYNIKINENEIVEIKLLDECPSMNKMSGTNMEKLCKGFFKVKDYGNTNVCVDPTVEPCIFIKIADGHQFLINSRDSEITKDLFNKLNK